MTDRGKWVEAEGDKPKVEPTRRYFAEIRASLKNGLDASRDLEAECERLREQLDTARQALEEIAALDSPHVTGTAGADKCHVCVARAALGVVGRGGRQ